MRKKFPLLLVFLSVFFLSVSGGLAGAAAMSDSEALRAHTPVFYKPGDKVEVFVPLEIFSTSSYWKNVRDNPDANRVLMDEENVTISPVMPYAVINRDQDRYIPALSFLFMAKLLNKPRAEILAFLDGVLKADRAGINYEKALKNAGWDEKEFREAGEKMSAEAAQGDPQKGQEFADKMRDDFMEQMMGAQKRYVKAVEEGRPMGREMTLSVALPGDMRFPVIVNGEPAPYLFHDMAERK